MTTSTRTTKTDPRRCAVNDTTCEGELWQCHACKAWHCQTHFHATSKGTCVECPSCEERRLDALATSVTEPRLDGIDAVGDRLDIKDK